MNSWKEIVEFVRSTYGITGKLNIQPYTYRINFSNLVAGATLTDVLESNANSDFVLINPTYRASVNDANPKVTPLVRVLMVDAGSSNQFSDQSVDLTTLFGSYGDSQSSLVYPRVIAGRSSIQIQASNYSTALAYNLELSFHGVQVQAYD